MHTRAVSYLPEGQKVLQRGRAHVYTVQERVSQEEDEELVVGEGDAVVDPGAVVVHLQDTVAAHAAMVATVGLHVATLLAETHLCQGDINNINALLSRRYQQH